MSNRRRAARPVVAGVDPGDAFESIGTATLTCHAGACEVPATRWYVRGDLDDDRLVVLPVCPMHHDRAERWCCPDTGVCVAPDDDPHYIGRHDDLAEPIYRAFVKGWGVGLPARHDWDRLDVLRPRQRARHS